MESGDFVAHMESVLDVCRKVIKYSSQGDIIFKKQDKFEILKKDSIGNWVEMLHKIDNKKCIYTSDILSITTERGRRWPNRELKKYLKHNSKMKQLFLWSLLLVAYNTCLCDTKSSYWVNLNYLSCLKEGRSICDCRDSNIYTHFSIDSTSNGIEFTFFDYYHRETEHYIIDNKHLPFMDTLYINNKLGGISLIFENETIILVSCHALIDGYSFLSFILASFELNLHSIVHSLLFL